jgi:hypothetical protein
MHTGEIKNNSLYPKPFLGDFKKVGYYVCEQDLMLADERGVQNIIFVVDGKEFITKINRVGVMSQFRKIFGRFVLVIPDKWLALKPPPQKNNQQQLFF